MNIAAYNKTIAAVVTGLLGWAGVVITSEPAAITASEWLALGVALATALGVYAIANGPTRDDGIGAVEAALVLLIVVVILVLI